MPRTRKEPDAIDLLKQDHRRVESLFKEFEKLHESDEHEAADAIAKPRVPSSRFMTSSRPRLLSRRSPAGRG